MAEPARPVTGTAPGQDPNAVYALGSSPGESARLQRQADELAADSAALLDRTGLRPGQSAIDARNTGLAPGSFDLVHARTLLINLPEPEGVAAEMGAANRIMHSMFPHRPRECRCSLNARTGL